MDQGFQRIACARRQHDVFRLDHVNRVEIRIEKRSQSFAKRRISAIRRWKGKYLEAV
jgi:hypothetical protein